MTENSWKMKTLSLVLALGLAVTFVASCSKLDIEKDTPKCIELKIKEFNDSSACDDAKVDKYLFQGANVYVFDPGTCGADMISDVFNPDCVRLGGLGGITGNTIIMGESFSHATLVSNVWSK